MPGKRCSSASSTIRFELRVINGLCNTNNAWGRTLAYRQMLFVYRPKSVPYRKEAVHQQFSLFFLPHHKMDCRSSYPPPNRTRQGGSKGTPIASFLETSLSESPPVSRSNLPL